MYPGSQLLHRHSADFLPRVQSAHLPCPEGLLLQGKEGFCKPNTRPLLVFPSYIHTHIVFPCHSLRELQDREPGTLVQSLVPQFAPGHLLCPTFATKECSRIPSDVKPSDKSWAVEHFAAPVTCPVRSFPGISHIEPRVTECRINLFLLGSLCHGTHRLRHPHDALGLRCVVLYFTLSGTVASEHGPRFWPFFPFG